jgi:acetyl esterase/lipase
VPATGYAVETAFDLRYYGSHPRQVLDVFRPKGVANAPVVLFVHGGAWMFGDKNLFGLYRSVGRFLASHGIVAVLINYRLSPEVKYPAHVQDLARAFAWTRRNIAKYGGDPDRIALCGHSAGGHLVALLATDPTYLNDPELGLKAADRAAVRGVAAICGLYEIPTPSRLNALSAALLPTLLVAGAPPEPSTHAARFSAGDLLRPVFGDDLKVREQASPLAHVHKGLPPFLVLYAERELPLLADMARQFARALREVGDSVELERIPDCHHNFILFRLSRPGDPTAAALLPFIERCTVSRR